MYINYIVTRIFSICNRYELFNSWHQSHFGRIPEYEVHAAAGNQFDCTMRFLIPENDKDLWRDQWVDVTAATRSKARERAAEMAYWFVLQNGLWINLKDAGLVPDFENSINQLQELYQKSTLLRGPTMCLRSVPPAAGNAPAPVMVCVDTAAEPVRLRLRRGRRLWCWRGCWRVGSSVSLE